jgi:hypothetical protein
MRKNNRGGEFDQTTLYACMEISQQNPFVQFTQANKRHKKYTPISFMNIKVVSPTKYQQIKYNSILKGLYTTTKWDLSQICKDD